MFFFLPLAHFQLQRIFATMHLGCREYGSSNIFELFMIICFTCHSESHIEVLPFIDVHSSGFVGARFDQVWLQRR